MLQLARALSMTVCVLSCVAPALLAQTAADEKEIAAYRLTMAGLKKYEAVSDHLAAWAKTNPEVQARARRDAQIDSLSKKSELTDKEQEKLDALEAERARISDADVEETSEEPTLAFMEKQIARYQPARDALAKAGMTAREYAVFTFALVQTGTHVALKQQGMASRIPKDANQANIAFFEQNAAAIEAVSEKTERVGKLVTGAMKKGS